MPCCVAINCSNRNEKGFRLFKFPSDKERRLKWIQFTRRGSWTPTMSSRLCEKHFEESQFETNRLDGWRKLKPNAIPTIFDDLDSPSEITPNRKRLLDKPTQTYGKFRYGNKRLKEESSALEASLEQSECWDSEHDAANLSLSEENRHLKEQLELLHVENSNLRDLVESQSVTIESLDNERTKLREQIKSLNAKVVSLEEKNNENLEEK